MGGKRTLRALLIVNRPSRRPSPFVIVFGAEEKRYVRDHDGVAASRQARGSLWGSGLGGNRGSLGTLAAAWANVRNGSKANLTR